MGKAKPRLLRFTSSEAHGDFRSDFRQVATDAANLFTLRMAAVVGQGGHQGGVRVSGLGEGVARQPALRMRASRFGINSKHLKTQSLNEIQSLSRLFSIT